ncbi:hypothetical protein T12_7463 [Trichinella patagoniensis]|uniref:Uncharacterized protein n=1 Tax=Trichinella patagoniensis TaxID=990121 RepID=A0A0V1AG48_9BILA|nr:hypothetical protein T12_7463 [Trichinella patagoniensis]
MCKENRQQWDEMLSFVMLAYNSSVNESTGVTPAMARFGRELTTAAGHPDGVAAEERHGNAAELHLTNERAH